MMMTMLPTTVGGTFWGKGREEEKDEVRSNVCGGEERERKAERPANISQKTTVLYNSKRIA